MTNQPSDAAKDLSHRIVCEFRPDGWMAKEIEIAHLIDRHLTPSEPVAKAFCNKCGYHGPVDKHGQHIRPGDGNPCNYIATPPATVNSDAGLVEALGKAVQWFDQYADEHERKALQTGDDSEVIARLAKAQTNKERADFLRVTLSRAKEEGA